MTKTALVYFTGLQCRSSTCWWSCGGVDGWDGSVGEGGHSYDGVNCGKKYVKSWQC